MEVPVCSCSSSFLLTSIDLRVPVVAAPNGSATAFSAICQGRPGAFRPGPALKEATLSPSVFARARLVPGLSRVGSWPLVSASPQLLGCKSMTSDGATAEVTAKTLGCPGPAGHLVRGAVGAERLKEHPERREVIAAEGMGLADHHDHADRRRERPARSSSRSPRRPEHDDDVGAEHVRPGVRADHGHTHGIHRAGAAAEPFGSLDGARADGDGDEEGQLRAAAGTSAAAAAHDQPDLHDSRRRSSGGGSRTHSRSRSRSLSREQAGGSGSGGEGRKLSLHRERDRERVSTRHGDHEHVAEGGGEGSERRGHKRDQPDRRGSRSRSRSGSLGRERDHERERERSHDKDRDHEGERSREGDRGRERELDRERERAPKRPHAEAGPNGCAAAGAAPAAAGPAEAGAASRRVPGSAASGAGAHAAAPGHGRLLVSFSDELDEDGGLGDGGSGGTGAAGGRRRSNGGGGMGYGGGNLNLSSLSTAAPGGGMGGGQMLIPTRTITTTAGGGGGAGGAAGGLAAQFSGFGSGPAAQPPPLPGSVGPYHHSSVVGGGTAAAAVAGMATEATAVDGSPLVLGGHRAGGGLLAGVAGGSPPRSPPAGGGGRTLGRVLFGVSTARCLRPYMEDRHAVVQSLRPLAASGAPLPADGVPRCLAAIYDGHNGTRAADTAASRLHMLLAADAALRSHTGELGPPAAMAAEEEAVAGALRRVFRRLDDDILAEARRDGARDGATALLVMRLADTLYAAHAGDSRAVLSRRGAALRLTEDHKPNLPHERRRVEAAGGRVDFQRCWRVIVEPREGRLGSGLAVSRSLGDLDFKEPRRFVECEPDVRRLVPAPGDNLVVLGSDGLWDVLGDQEAVDVANAALTARAVRALQSAGGGGAASPLAAFASNPASTTTGTGASPGAQQQSGSSPQRPYPGHPGPRPHQLPPPGYVYKEEDARAAADALLEAAVRRGTADNVTVIVMLLQWD